MKLYINNLNDINAHQIRMIMNLKDIDAEIIELDPNSLPEFFEDINQNLSLPVLVNQSISIYHTFVIIQYLDERFPHPSIMSNDPLNRAIRRRMMLDIQNTWYPHIKVLENNTPSKKNKTSQEALKNQLLEIEGLISGKYLLNDEPCILDIVIASILWRCKKYKIKFPPNLKRYVKNIFKQSFFKRTLNKKEYEMMFNEKDKYHALSSETYFNSIITQIVDEM